MNLRQEKIDTELGQLILEQYKMRKKLGLLFHKSYSHADLICSKYREKHLAQNECTSIDMGKDNDTNLVKEFERVLQELQRREELIQQLLAKIESYESTPKELKSLSTDSLLKFTKTYSEFVQTPESLKPEIKDAKGNNESKCLFLWKSILSEMVNSKKIIYPECKGEKQVSNLNVKCRHERLVDLYKIELSALYEEVEKLKMSSNSHY